MDFIFVSLQRIGTDRDSTATSLAKELAKEHRVLYVNPPIDRRTLYFNKNDEYTEGHIRSIRKKERSLVHLHDNLWALNSSGILESINWIPFTRVFRAFNWLNNHRFAKDIASAIKELAFANFILINDKDIFRSFYLKELLKPEKYIYLDRDYTIGMDYWKRHGVSLEPELMAKSDAVICNSTDFTDRARRYNTNSFYIGNGYASEQYAIVNDQDEPADLQIIPHPRIGYVGALITLRLDLPLIIYIARQKPQWSIVLIGWEDETFAKSELHQLPNVFFLGKKHTRQVPAYIRYLDVCINPQVLNEITRGNFPLKIVEYLAMGKPVVATETNTMREVFSTQTYLASGPHEFIKRIEEAISEDTKSVAEERKQFVGQFTWKNVTSNLLKCIREITGNARGRLWSDK